MLNHFDVLEKFFILFSPLFLEFFYSTFVLDTQISNET